MAKPTITIIGGGSVHWMPAILTDIAMTPALHGTRIVLQDINQAPLDLICQLAPSIFRRANAEFQLESTTDLRAALTQTDYVVVAIGVGGVEAMRRDLDVPAKYGIAQSVGDTIGPGGLSRALRHIPVLVQIAQEMERTCPQAWLLNFTNPMTTLCRAVTKTTKIKTVGMCHELIGTLQFLRDIFAIEDASDLQYMVAGINHMIWLLGLKIRGEDGFAMLRQYIAEHGTFGHVPAQLPGSSKSVFEDRYAIKLELFKAFGALPAVNDRHIAEFFPYFLSPESQMGVRYGVELTTIPHRRERMAAEQERVKAMAAGNLEVPAEKSKEVLADILEALVTRRDAVHVLNLPNTGQVSNLPRDATLETLAVIGAHEACPLTVGDLPLGVLNTLLPHVVAQELTVEAALTGDKDLALQALLTDPLTVRSFLDARSMLDELLAANAPYLPQFAC